MTIQDIEQLLTARRLEIYQNTLENIGKGNTTDKDKLDAFLLAWADNMKQAERCMRFLADTNLTGLDSFAGKRIIEAFAFGTNIHLEVAAMLLRQARKYATDKNMYHAVCQQLQKTEKKQHTMKATFDEALKGFRTEYTGLLGNEQVIMDATLKSELGEYLKD